MTEEIFGGEYELQRTWLKKITPIIAAAGLKIPDEVKAAEIAYGGRKGFHSEHLKPLLDEMCEVVRTDPEAEW